MFIRSCRILARAFGVPWEGIGCNATNSGLTGRKMGASTAYFSAKRREGTIEMPSQLDDKPLRKALNVFLPDNHERQKLTDLPGVEFPSDLPADPITRLFFQAKGDQGLYQGTYDEPANRDWDRIQLEKRETPQRRWYKRIKIPMYDFCHRIREAGQQRKRFAIIYSTFDAKGVAQVMHNHGLIAGFRDFHNDRAFAIELKYYQNEHVIHTIEPISEDAKIVYEWSPIMCRSFLNQYGLHNKIRIFILRTYDGRVIDHITAARENIGGRGLCIVQ